jgi:transposase
MKKKGPESWRDVPNPGRTPRLTVHQREELICILKKGPKAAGFSNDYWTQELVILVMRKEFDVRYSISGVSTMLKSIHGEMFVPRMRTS